MGALPHIVHGVGELPRVVVLIVRPDLLHRLVANVDAEVPSVGQRDVAEPERKLVSERTNSGILVAVEQIAQLGLCLTDLPVVGVEERLHEPLPLSL